ncbi:rod shape-determining protein MreC [Fictibacillus macauensis ZFHKF-1]|uniref:Cell shape-determining protein MreC n=2 Tax=Fictibacillus TaxID=1329200 RepID=I8J0Q7_9BACL|nr:rod shape-determining protein MreC [Fictibacillus macauensis ZFHKF-1]
MIGFSMKDREELTWPEQFLNDVVGTSQSLLYKPAHSVAGFFENIADMKDMYSENETLKSKLAQYATVSQDVQKLKNENDSLKNKLEKPADLTDYKVRDARIIGRSPDRWNQSVSINLGSRDGITTEMAVVSPEGLIGRIDKVSMFHSTVKLMNDNGKNNNISAIVEGKERIFGTIEGYDQKKQALVFSKLPSKTALAKGQKVITSGLGEGFPRGVLIGTVDQVVEDESDDTQIAYVKPAAGFYNLDHVMVLDRRMQPVDVNQFKAVEEVAK